MNMYKLLIWYNKSGSSCSKLYPVNFKSLYKWYKLHFICPKGKFYLLGTQHIPNDIMRNLNKPKTWIIKNRILIQYVINHIMRLYIKLRFSLDMKPLLYNITVGILIRKLRCNNLLKEKLLIRLTEISYITDPLTIKMTYHSIFTPAKRKTTQNL